MLVASLRREERANKVVVVVIAANGASVASLEYNLNNDVGTLMAVRVAAAAVLVRVSLRAVEQARRS